MLKRFLPFVLMFLWIASSAGAAGLDFVPNVGQARDGSAFSTEIPGAHVAFRPTSLEYTFAVSDRLVPARMEMIGANPRAAVSGTGLLPGIVNVYTATNSFSEIPTFGGLRYESVYPGIDLELGGVSGNLKSTWVVAPKADPARIRWRYHGFDHVQVDAEGNLVMTLPEEARTVTETAPIAWQNVEGRRVPVEVRYQERKDGSLSFEVGAYDKTAPLVIDPTLIYNRKLFSHTLTAEGIDVDAAGNVYLGGPTSLGTGYVTRMNPAGVRQWTTYFNGDRKYVHDLELGPNNDVYVAGSDGGQGFTAKLNSAGARIYEVANGPSGIYSIAVDAQGNSYIAGADALTKRNAAGAQVYRAFLPVLALSAVALDEGNPVVAGTVPGPHVYVAALDAGGGIVQQTTFGGMDRDYPTGIAIGANGRIYVVGGTASPDFPLIDPVDGRLTDPRCDQCTDGFVTVLSSGMAIQFSTFFGGVSADAVRDVAVGADGAIYFSGWTLTNDDGDFPCVNEFALPMGGSDAFVAKLAFHEDVGRYDIEYSTPLGDPARDSAWRFALQGGDVYLSGSSEIADGTATAFVAKVRDVLLPIGDVVNINFQPEDSEVPEGYLPDSGLPFDKRGNGWEYGWVPFGAKLPELAAGEFDREIDQQLDTWVGLAEPQKTLARWEIGLKPGRYSVRLMAGSPESPETAPAHWTQIYAEGVPLISDFRTPEYATDRRWVEGIANVAVHDGRLTLTLDSRAGEWMSVQFVEIGQATEPNQPPSVKVTSPLWRAGFNADRPVTIHAEAEDTDGRIARVDFFATNAAGKRQFLGSDMTAPYSWEWGCNALACPGVAVGNYALDAVAVDNEGATKTSAPVQVSVNALKRQRDFFKVEIKVFVPDQTTDIFYLQPLHDGEVAQGDDRGFSTTSQQFRVAHQATLIPSQILDPDGVVWASLANLAGGAVHWEEGSSVNPETGRLTPQALSEPINQWTTGVPYMVEFGALIPQMSITPMMRPSPTISQVLFEGSVDDPLVWPDCPIEWNIWVQVDVRNPAVPEARVFGWHKWFPAFEVYIDGEPVYRWMPPAGTTSEMLCLPLDRQLDTFIELK